ncbi:flavin-containing monooxygenase [Microbacterium sp. No. 7]|uniref:flavin-containing monooxygenase n=1 Tax=Microbacterium sp. No. 7 TaxID=1714373 RepID=UPI0006D24CF4|nr:NAD(P)/FAD-dependent oxidoreductase [Microbacterium sp. No. 7]ALJ20457.1 hypothetical protein AOA12_11280 [Microbacterium sp. No. 7]
MVTETATTTSPAADIDQGDYDVVIIGAGFGGLAMLRRVRELGLSTVAFERAPDVGGTWYWNAYPGARCDVESLQYNYSFDPELRTEYQSKWPERYSQQPQILEYARHVADRYNLRGDIRFERTVTRVSWDEDARKWTIVTDRGDRVTCTFVLTAVGCLSDSKIPGIPGVDDFQGESCHTGRFPHEGVNFSGKRVVQIGTGSSGVQIAPVLARTAAHLTILQRTPQYSVPAGNVPMTPEFVAQSLKAIEQAKAAMAERPMVRRLWESLSTKSIFDDTPEERQAYLEALWVSAGAYFPFGYRDTMTDPAANEIISEFARDKIRSIVKDPETVRKLLPTYPMGTKRQIVDTGYFEIFNESHVDLVDVHADPIERIVPEGVQLASGKVIEADIIVYATGFDAMTGPLLGLNIIGVDGQRLQDAWEAGPQTYLGLSTHGFPNLFMLTGPGSPSVLSNVIEAIEQHVDWLTDLLSHLRDKGVDRIEAELRPQTTWTQHVTDMANESLWPKADSWYLGANIPGKPRVFMPYIGGSALYQSEIDDVAAKEYEGFTQSPSRMPVAAG